MEYHEIGERIKHKGVVLEVVQAEKHRNPCEFCFFFKPKVYCGKMFCRSVERKDMQEIYYKLVVDCKPNDMEQCKPKDMEQESDGSRKNDRLDDKLRWELLPLEDVEDIVRVYTAGAKKYGPDQWQNLPDGIKRYKAALLRHLVEFDKGNEIDEETGCRHLAQVAWNAIAMLHISKQQKQ